MKCSECQYCKIGYDKNSTCCRARCTKLATAKTEGKSITWAFDASKSRTFTNIIPGSETVKKELASKKKAPSWCPLKEGE